jgi:membrane-associated phospholipid phosphatase
MHKFFAQRRRVLWTGLIALLFGATLIFAAFQLDPAVHAWQRKHRWKNIKALSRNVTRATDWYTHVGAGLLLAGIAWKRKNKKWARVFLAMVLAAALAGTSAYALKLATGRVRPSVKIENVSAKPDTHSDFQAFPSGHTAVSSGFFAVLFFVSWRLGLLFLPIPIFVAFSRIFLGAHYLSDVVAAAVLGFLAAYLVVSIMFQEFRIPNSEFRN